MILEKRKAYVSWREYVSLYFLLARRCWGHLGVRVFESVEELARLSLEYKDTVDLRKRREG